MHKLQHLGRILIRIRPVFCIEPKEPAASFDNSPPNTFFGCSIDGSQQEHGHQLLVTCNLLQKRESLLPPPGHQRENGQYPDDHFYFGLVR